MRSTTHSPKAPADHGAPSAVAPVDLGPPTDADPPEWTEDRAHTVIGLLAFAGTGLTITGELSDRLESDLGLGVLNLFIAATFAVLALSVAALLGDALSAAIGRRSARRPSHSSVTLLLLLAGAATAIGILIAHQAHPLALDSWLALTGGVLLLIAALAHHQLPHERGRGRL